jgi:hypothetical protein
MADPNAVAEKIARKASDLLDPLRLEMAMNKWPDEFRTIMWQAVADTASRLAADAATAQKAQSTQTEETHK